MLVNQVKSHLTSLGVVVTQQKKENLLVILQGSEPSITAYKRQLSHTLT